MDLFKNGKQMILNASRTSAFTQLQNMELIMDSSEPLKTACIESGLNFQENQGKLHIKEQTQKKFEEK